MCTLSVITSEDEYLLAMNRDERIARGAGEIPEIRQIEGVRIASPSDGAGGAWIGVNEYGITLALLNWNDVVRQPLESGRARSRGRIISALGSSSRLADLQRAFDCLDLERIPPFRLVGVLPSEKAIGEWRWDSARLTFEAHEWEPRHWFSSSLSDTDAESLRGSACHTAAQESDAGSALWLRRLHASHAGGPGPFSVCVHRKEVETLSYTEVVVAAEVVRMGHFRGKPCTLRRIDPIEIKRADRLDPAL